MEEFLSDLGDNCCLSI